MRVTATVADFAAAARIHLPRKLRQLRQLGAATRELGKGKSKR